MITLWETCPNCDNETFALFADGSKECYICGWKSRSYDVTPEQSLAVLDWLNQFAAQNPGVEIEIEYGDAPAGDEEA